jgi:hypothetical protein
VVASGAMTTEQQKLHHKAVLLIGQDRNS